MATFSYTTAPTWPIQGGAVVATTVAGVLNTTSEVQTVTITATGGTFKLIYDGQVTSALAYNASTATVQAALWALSNIADNAVAVTGTAGNYTLTWINSLGNVNPVEVVTKSLTATATASERGWIHPVTGEVLVAIKDLDDKQTDIASVPTFTGVLSGAKGVATVATTVQGVTGTTSEVTTIAIVATGGTFTITYSGQTTTPLAYNASTATVQAALWALSNIADSAVAVTGTPSNYTLTWINSLGNIVQPIVTATSLLGNRKFFSDDVMIVTVTASEAVTVDGTPKLNLSINSVNRSAFYDGSVSTPTSLVFKYTIVGSDVATAGQFTVGTSITLDTNISDNLATGGYVPISAPAKVISAMTTNLVTVNT
jgi:hypothetical protein